MADKTRTHSDPHKPRQSAADTPGAFEEEQDVDGVDAAAGQEHEDGPAPADDIAALRRERDDNYDRLVRTTAEYENYRRRVERERREQADKAVTDLFRELLLVVDDFDRALTAEHDEGSAAYRRGVELIHTKLHDLLKRHGIKSIDVLGADFDPNVHQAVIHEESPEHREGEVIGELQRGYTMNGKLLRPAMVKVAKA